MADKTYWLQFGSGDPRNNTGLTPTMLILQTEGGSALAGVPITEVGVSTGAYKFQYEPSATYAIWGLSDGGNSLSDGDRYVVFTLDPIQTVDQRLGYNTDSYGNTLTDPATAFGFVRRTMEFLEGNAEFIKASGIWNIYDRGGTLLLRQKDLTNTTTLASKT